MQTLHYGHNGFHVRDPDGAVVPPSDWAACDLRDAQIVVDFGEVEPSFEADMGGEWTVCCSRHELSDDVAAAGAACIQRRATAAVGPSF